jgi:nitrogen fixation protein
VQQLEIIPVQQQELTNEQTLVANGNALAVVQTKQVTDLTAQVTGLKLQSIDDAKVCQAQIAVVQTDARKSKRRYFIAGFVAGIATRILGKF